MRPVDPPALPPQPVEPAPFPGAPSEQPAAKDAGKNALPGTATPEQGGDAAKPSAKAKSRGDSGLITQAIHEEPGGAEELPPGASTAGTPSPPMQSDSAAAGDTTGAIGAHVPLPPGWPDERGFIPPPPSPVRPACCPTNGPVMTHTRIYQGNDGEFTEALASYYHFRDDARFGGWQNYLGRSDDFIRFCCHMHIAEMLSARGGAGETRVVWSWSDCR